MKIIFIGPYPPPYGGISVHIKRMKVYLEKKNIDVVIYNESKKRMAYNIIPIKKYSRFIFIIPFLKGDVIHFHSGDKKIRILLGLYKVLNKKIILTLHGESLNNQIIHSNIFTRFLLLKSLKLIDKIVCVNPKNREELLTLGFNKNRVTYIPSYINPIEEKNDIEDIPKHIIEFTQKSNFLISANGCVRFYKNKDLYGFDMLIELLCEINKSNIDASLIINVLVVDEQNEQEKKYYNYLKSKILELNLSKRIMLFEVNNMEFYPILKESKLFIRPTNTDGFGVSIAEAIYYNIPAIASDVCNRPEGTILFKSRDSKDLYNKVMEVFDNYEIHKKMIKDIKFEDNAEKLLNVYKEINKGGEDAH